MSRRTPHTTPTALAGRLDAVLSVGLAHHGRRRPVPTDVHESPKRARLEMPTDLFTTLPEDILEIILSATKGMSCEQIYSLCKLNVAFKTMCETQGIAQRDFFEWQCELRDYDREGRLFPTKTAEAYWDAPVPGKAKVPYMGDWKMHYEWWCSRQFRHGPRPAAWTQEVDLSLAAALYELDDPHPYFGPIREWDVSQVASLSSPDKLSLFEPLKTKRMFDYDISQWDVSNVEDMSDLFSQLPRMDSDISKWNVSKVKKMDRMFRRLYGWNGNISGWKVHNVESMRGMFIRCANFNGDLSQWKVGKVKDMNAMFMSCEKFNSDISNWDVGNVEDMSNMFAVAVLPDEDEEPQTSVFNRNLSGWNVSNVKKMSQMFHYAHNFNNGKVPGEADNSLKKPGEKFFNDWKVGNVTNMQAMFKDAESFNCDISQWNVSKVKKMGAMFEGAVRFNCGQEENKSHELLQRWDVSSVMEIYGMFSYADDFNGSLSEWKLTDSAQADVWDIFTDQEKASRLLPLAPMLNDITDLDETDL